MQSNINTKKQSITKQIGFYSEELQKKAKHIDLKKHILEGWDTGSSRLFKSRLRTMRAGTLLLYMNLPRINVINTDCKTNIFKPENKELLQAGANSNYLENALFPIPKEADQVIYAVDYGVVANTGADMSEPIKAAVQKLRDLGQGKKLLVFPKGDILVKDSGGKGDYAIDIQGINDLFVDFGGVTFYMDLSLRGVRVSQCQNVTLANLNIDRCELPYFMGTIEEMNVEDGYAIVTVNDGYALEDDYPCREYLEFVPDTKEPVYHGNFLYNNSGVDGTIADIKRFTLLSGRRARIDFGCKVTQAPKGAGFVMSKTMYGVDTICVENSSNIKCENINVYCTAGMGIRGNSCDDIYFNRTNVCLKPDTDRYMTVTADAMHFIDCKGDLQITNSLFENSHDDAINIHGMFQMVVETDIRKKAAKFDVARSVRFGKPVKNNPLTIPFRKGDIIELSKDKTLDFKQNLTVVDYWFDEDYGFWATFEETPDIVVGDIASNITRTPKVLIKNCVFKNKRNRGILLQSRNSIIEDCTFYNVIMTGICIFCDCLNWYESLNPRNIKIKRNKFINTNIKPNNFGNYSIADIDICVYGQGGIGRAGLISDIDITENIFKNSGTAAISIQSARRVHISDNYIIHPCSETQTAPANCAIYLNKSEDVHIGNNEILPFTAEHFTEVYQQHGDSADNIIN